uniref:C2H2-type domain-containing protein n=1 Tax=Oryza punctata TaxID=4537 RepID=A0A0E0KVB2_ORYPU
MISSHSHSMSAKTMRAQALSKTPYLVKSSDLQNEASDANGSGFSVVEKEHPRSLTPMLWAKKVEHFSEHQTKRPCWEQCLRHLQRDRRTEPAVDLTVVSRFRALTDSNDSARYQRHMTCGENFCDQRYLPMHMLSHEIESLNQWEREGEGYRGQCATLFVGVGPPRPG